MAEKIIDIKNKFDAIYLMVKADTALSTLFETIARNIVRFRYSLSLSAICFPISVGSRKNGHLTGSKKPRSLTLSTRIRHATMRYRTNDISFPTAYTYIKRFTEILSSYTLCRSVFVYISLN